MASLVRRFAWLLAIALAGAPACSSTSAPSGDSAWSRGVALPGPRFEAFAAVANGKIHFIGGITGADGDVRTANPSRRVDVFDPVTQAWSAGPDLPDDAPKHHLTVATWEDRIYVLGGFDGILDQRPGEPFRPIATSYVLDGASWRRLAKAPLARGGATAQAIEGKIYVAGGAPNEGQPSYDQLDIYDIGGDRWSTGVSMPTAREHVASCAIDGRMMVVGGWSGAARPAHADAEEYDPKTNAWRALPSLSVARGGLAAVAVDGTCHVIGGEDWALPLPGTFGTHDVLERGASAWRSSTPMPTARHGLGLARIGDHMYAVGGGPSQGNSYTATVEIFRR